MSISIEQVYAAIARLEARADAAAAAQAQAATSQAQAIESLHRRIDDKFSGIQAHLERQDERLDKIEEKVGVAHDNALNALGMARNAGALSGAVVSTLVQGGIELAKAFLKP